jgi:phage I-like protein
MRPFTALLDSPVSAAGTIQIAQLGDYSDPRYGDFQITAGDVADWQKNLTQLPGGEALIDFEHRSERKPRDSRAAGWITGIELDGDKVIANARWTPDGEQAIKDGSYRFISPAYGEHRNEHGVTFENTLMSVALTNKPALTGLPAVVLASEERVSEAAGEEIVRLLDMDADLELDELQTARLVMLSVTAAERKRAKTAGNSLPDGSYPINNASQLHSAAVLAASGHGNAAAAKKLIRRRAKEMGVDLTHLPGMTSDNDADDADSRQHEMPDAALIKLLDLPEDADEATVLEAVGAVKTKADKPSKKEVKRTLEQEATDKGLVLLDKNEVKKLQQGYADLAVLKAERHTDRFETAFDAAQRDRKVTPGEKDTLKELYDAAPDATLKMLDARQPIMPDKPQGQPAIEFDPSEPDNFDADNAVRGGMEPGSVMLDAKVRAHLRDKGLPESEYITVLDQVVNGGLQL